MTDSPKTSNMNISNLNVHCAEKAYIVGIHRYSFRCGKPAEIIGVKIVTPCEGDTPRTCYHVMYEDGVDDYVPITFDESYTIISFSDIVDGNIPVVKH